jgi:hypothetical protein
MQPLVFARRFSKSKNAIAQVHVGQPVGEEHFSDEHWFKVTRLHVFYV